MSEKEAVPGFGISGKVMCPMTQSLCTKDVCELWVPLNYGKQIVGRCSLAWIPVILTEMRQALTNLKSHE